MYKCTAYFMFYLVNFSKEKSVFFVGFIGFFQVGFLKKTRVFLLQQPWTQQAHSRSEHKAILFCLSR